MTEWLTLVLASFAAYRIARMITQEDGFFDVFINFRTWIFNKFGNGWINNGVNCFHCAAFWAALVITFILLQMNATPFNFQFLLEWFGIAGIASFLWSIESK